MYKYLTVTGVGFAIATVLASPTAATDFDNLFAVQRDAFRAEVRAYLIEEPEVLMEAMEVLERIKSEAEAQRDAKAISTHAEYLFASPFDVVLGNLDGDVTVVEFFDYRCSYCRRAHADVKELIKSDGNIRFVLKELPILGEESILASRFAIATRIALGVEAYAEVHDGLMQMRGGFNDSSLKALADELGLDSSAIMVAVEDRRVQATIDYNRLLAQQLFISGTPSFVLGDQLARGYVPLDSMKDIVARLRE